MIYEVKWSAKFKKSYKLAKKRGLDTKLLEGIVDKLRRTEFYWKKNIMTMS